MQTFEPVSTLAIDETYPQVTASRGRRNRASAARAGWQNRYAVTLGLIDFLVGLCAASAALTLRFGPHGNEPHLRGYLLLTLLFPVAWILTLAINRAYEPRHLFVGTDEYARVFRSGIGLTAVLAIVSFSFDLRLARGYVIIAMPLVTVADIGVRHMLRRMLHRSWARGDHLHRVILVGHQRAVADMTRRLRDERHHGLGVIGACLPPGTDVFTPGLPPVYGTFDEVAAAVVRCDADTVVVLSCPELDGPALRRLAWQLERDEIDLIVASTLVDVAGDRTTIRPVDGLPMLHVEHPRLKGSARIVKEVFDRVGALLLLVVAAPLMERSPRWYGSRPAAVARQSSGRSGSAGTAGRSPCTSSGRCTWTRKTA